MGVDNKIVFTYKQSTIIPPGQVFVFLKNGKFHVRSREKLSTMQITLAINNWFKVKQEKELASNAK